MLYNYTEVTAGNPISLEQQSQALTQVLKAKGFQGGYDESIIEAIGADTTVFYRNTLPNIDDAILDEVVGYSDGVESAIITHCLDRFNGAWRSTLEQSSSDSRENLLTRMLYKSRTYDTVLEQRQEKIQMIGFEKDSDFNGTQALLTELFGEDLLNRCLISEIEYEPDKVYINVNGVRYFIPSQQFTQIANEMPWVHNYRYRAESLSNWNLDMNFSTNFRRLPIKIFSFLGQPLEGFLYLNGLSNEEKIRTYKQGTVVHEVGHLVYDFVLNKDQRENWEKLSGQSRNITSYTGLYQGKSTEHEENFCEALRLFSLSKEYLRVNNPEIYEFVETLLNEIKSGEFVTEKEIIIHNKTLYHGSPVAGITQMNSAIETTVGEGIYLTSDLNAARGYAERRVKSPHFKVTEPVPVVYDVNIENARLINLKENSTLLAILPGFRSLILSTLTDGIEKSWNYEAVLNQALDSIDIGKVDIYHLKKLTQSLTPLFTQYITGLGYDGLVALEGGEGNEVGNHDTYLLFNNSKIKSLKARSIA